MASDTNAYKENTSPRPDTLNSASIKVGEGIGTVANITAPLGIGLVLHFLQKVVTRIVGALVSAATTITVGTVTALVNIISGDEEKTGFDAFCAPGGTVWAHARNIAFGSLAKSHHSDCTEER